MNWGFIMWFGGILFTIGVLKFMLAFFKALTGKEARQKAIDSVGDKINNAAEDLSYYVKKKAAERKQRKMEEERPIITIR